MTDFFRYQPYEIIVLEVSPSKSSDIYSLGMIIFEMLEEDKPFKEFQSFQDFSQFIKEDTRPIMKREIYEGYEYIMLEVMMKCLDQTDSRPNINNVLEELEWNLEKIYVTTSYRMINYYYEDIYKESLFYEFLYVESLMFCLNDPKWKNMMKQISEKIIDEKNDIELYCKGMSNLYLEQTELGLSLLEKSSKMDNPMALNSLGEYFGKKKENIEKAMEYYKRAANLGYAKALNNIGNLYYVKEEYEKAYEYYFQSSQKNYPNSFFNIGHLFENGLFFEKSLEKSLQFYHKGVELKDSYSMMRISNLYDSSENSEDLNYLLMAMEEGNAEAINKMAIHLYESNLEKAENLLKNSIERGSINAYFYSALLKGKETEGSYNSLKLASKKGHKYATLFLAISIENQYKSIKYYRKFSEQEKISRNLSPIEKEMDRKNQEFYENILKTYISTDILDNINSIEIFRYKIDLINPKDVSFHFEDYDDNSKLISYSLPNLIYSKKLSRIDKRKIIIEICKELKKLHQNGVIIGTLTSSSIYITYSVSYTVKFLKSIQINEKEIAKDFYRYVPFEVIVKREALSLQADIYSLGMIIFELLEEEKPFKEVENYQDFLKFLKEDTRPSMKKIYNESYESFMKNIMMKCLDEKEFRPKINDVLNELEWDINKIFRNFNGKKPIYYFEDIYHQSSYYLAFYVENLRQFDEEKLQIIFYNQAEEFDEETIEMKDDYRLYYFGLRFIFFADIEKGFSFIHKSAEMDNPLALNFLGTFFNEEPEKSIEYYKKVANLGISYHQVYLGVWHFKRKEYKESYEYFLKASKNNDPESFYCLAQLYEVGYHVQKDPSKAFLYYKLAANYDHLRSILKLSSIYLKNIKTDEKLFLRYTKIAMKLGSNDAFNLMAIYYKEKNDEKKAIEYFQLAIEKGLVDSIYNLGVFYGNLQRFKEAIQQHKIASKKGFLKSSLELAYIYTDVPNELNFYKAIKILKKVSKKTYQDFLKNKKNLIIEEGVKRINQQDYKKGLVIMKELNVNEYLDFLETVRFKIFQFSEMKDITFHYE